MNSQDYLLGKLNSLRPTTPPLRGVDDRTLTEIIVKFITTKKFRKYALSPQFLKYIHLSVEHAVKRKQPIEFIFVFGGYKLWRLDSAPEPDWAEIFALLHYSRWLKPICEIYEPGVHFDFYSDDIVIELLNNIHKPDTERYIYTFGKLLEFMKIYQPDNLHMTLTRTKDQYGTQEEFTEALNNSIAYFKSHPDALPPLTQKIIKGAKLNIRAEGNDSDELSYEDKHLLLHAYSSIPRQKDYITKPGKMRVSPLTPQRTLALGTTKSSIVKFWVGMGALYPSGLDYNQVILPPSQIKTTSFIDSPINIGIGLKNFSTIPVISKNE